jgi:hypothetical protein
MEKVRKQNIFGAHPGIGHELGKGEGIQTFQLAIQKIGIYLLHPVRLPVFRHLGDVEFRECLFQRIKFRYPLFVNGFRLSHQSQQRTATFRGCHRAEGHGFIRIGDGEEIQKFPEGACFQGIIHQKRQGRGEQKITDLLAGQPESPELIFAAVLKKTGMQCADIAQIILSTGKDQTAQAVFPEHGTVSVGIQNEMGRVILFNDMGTDLFRHRPGHGAVFFCRVLIDVDLPSLTAGVSATAGSALKIRIKGRNYGMHEVPPRC